jgi:hypothetical protein
LGGGAFSFSRQEIRIGEIVERGGALVGDHVVID